MDSTELAALLALAGQNQPFPARPIAEAQAMELRARLPHLTPNYDFVPGDLVIEKPGVGNTKPELRGRMVTMFVRRLNEYDAVDLAVITQALNRFHGNCLAPDCLTCYLSGDGACLVMEPNFSGYLRLRTPEDDKA